MLNTRPSQQLLKVSTFGFQTCLHMTFHISKGAMESLWCDGLNLTLNVVLPVLQCSRHVLFAIRLFQLMDGCDVVGMNLGFLGGSV
jgi:hypothetical protein